MCLPNLTRLQTYRFAEHRPILCVEIKVNSGRRLMWARGVLVSDCEAISVCLKYVCGPLAGTWFPSLAFQSYFLHPTSPPVRMPAVGPFHSSQSPGLGSFLGADGALDWGKPMSRFTRGKQVGSLCTHHFPQGTSCCAPSTFFPASSSCLGW